MLMMVDFDENKRQLYPSVKTVEETAKPWKISIERHGAYEGMWRAIAYAGVVANTAAWLYF